MRAHAFNRQGGPQCEQFALDNKHQSIGPNVSGRAPGCTLHTDRRVFGLGAPLGATPAPREIGREKFGNSARCWPHVSLWLSTGLQHFLK